MTLLEILYRKNIFIGQKTCLYLTRINNMKVESFQVYFVAESPVTKEIYAIGFLNDKPFMSTLNTTEFTVAPESL